MLQVDNEGTRNVIRSERSAGKRGHRKDEKYHSRWLPPHQHRGGIRRREAALGGGILEKAFMREPKTLEKEIMKEEGEREQEEKEVWHLSNQEFYNEEDALKAAQEREKRWKYHRTSATAMETKRNRENVGRGETRKRRANTEIAKHFDQTLFKFDDTAYLSGV